MSIKSRINGWLAERRGAALPVPQRSGTMGGFLQTLNLHNLDVRPIPTKTEQLDNYVGWVYGCVSKIAQDLRVNPRGLWVKTGKRREDWKPIQDKNIPPLIRRPNLYQTWGQFIEMRNQHKDLTGEAWWHFITNTVGGKPIGLELIQPDWVDEPIYNEQRTAITGWWVAVPGAPSRPIDARDLIMDFYPNPKDRTRGASPVEAFALAHHLDLYLRAYGVKLIRDGALIGQYVTSETVKSPQQADEAEARIMRRYRTPGRIPVLGQGSKLESVTLPFRDMAFITMLRPSQDQILALYGVPRSKFGLTEGAGDTNQKVADKAYQENTLLPRLLTFDEIMNEVVLPRMGVQTDNVVYESESPVEVDREWLLKKAQAKFDSGGTTVNQFFQELGDEELGPEGDVHFLPNNITVVKSLIGASEAATLKPQPQPADNNPPPQDQGGNNNQGGGQQQDKQSKQGGGNQKKAIDEAGLRIARAISRSHQSQYETEIRKLRRKASQLEFEKVQGRHEAIAKQKLRPLFDKEKKAVKQAINENLKTAAAQKRFHDAIRSDRVIPYAEARNWLDDTLDRFLEDWRSLLAATTLAGAEAGWVLLQQELVGALTFKQYERKASEFARHHAGERIHDIRNSTEDQLRAVIVDGIENGKSVHEISLAVGAIYDDWKGFRAETIAMTETSTSISWGRFQNARETRTRTGMDVRRSWLSVHDNRTRPDHDAADGDSRNQNISLDQFYIVGGVDMAHPCDPNAPPEQTIRCRCTETYHEAEPESA